MRPPGQGSHRDRREAADADGGRGSAPRRRKALGQHHLKDGRSCRPLIDFLRLAPGEAVLEIGPGGGVLTRELLAAGGRVAAIELDLNWGFDLLRRAREFPARETTTGKGPVRDHQDQDKARAFHRGEKQKGEAGEVDSAGAGARPVSALHADGEARFDSPAPPTEGLSVVPFNESLSVSPASRLSGSSVSASNQAVLSLSLSRDSASGLSIVVADALDLAWEGLPEGWRVAGNLPYNVGTVIVEGLLRGAPVGTRAAFLLQREVVDRMVARPGDDAYGALSVLVAARARATRLGLVKPGAFAPPPKVDSAFVGLETIAPPLPEAAMPAFERVVQIAFGQRRKNLRNALGAGFGRDIALAALGDSGIDPGRRAEELSLDEFRRLSGAFEAASSAAGC